MNSFHGNLNRMALFTAFVLCIIIIFYRTFFEIATANIYLNGVIIGTTLFGIILCFIKMFALLPEHRWLTAYKSRRNPARKMPNMLRSVAAMLRRQSGNMTENGLRSIMDMVMIRFEDDRDSVRYITNTLVFLGLLGTFWGLIVTVGGFATLIGNLNFNDESVLQSMQTGLSQPLGGMATAFTSSLLGLGGSLVVGFLAMQVNMAQGAIFHELEEFLAKRTNIEHPDTDMWPVMKDNMDKIINSLKRIDDNIEYIASDEY